MTDELRKYQGMKRQAGEVRFIKDKSADQNTWAWDPGRHAESRNIPANYDFGSDGVKMLIEWLRATTLALGHTLSVYNQLSKAKSRDFSPDGMIGGTGYVKKISGIRQEYNNIIEALSSLCDTYYDEITADHWNQSLKSESQDVQDEVGEMLEEVEDIRFKPEGFARQKKLEQTLFTKDRAKTASNKASIDINRIASRIANTYITENR